MSALCGPGCSYCGMCSAAWERDDYAPDEPVSVRVESDGEPKTYIGCTADSYDIGLLTVTVLETGFEHVFGPSEWLEAIAYDERGNVLFYLSNPLPVAGMRAAQVSSERT